MLYLDEIFVSIQGESTDAGLPCVFVRLFGCNVKCTYCDQPQKACNRKRVSVDNLIQMIKKYRVPYVCITGGEPLIQDDVYPVIYELVDEGYKVSIETNGCVPIDPCSYNRSYKYVMDIKCPSSGVSDKNILTNLGNLMPHDEVKFVIADEEDYKFAKRILRSYPTSAKILFSPMFDDKGKPMIGQKLIDWLLEDRFYYARVQIQMHKCIGVK